MRFSGSHLAPKSYKGVNALSEKNRNLAVKCVQTLPVLHATPCELDFLFTYAPLYFCYLPLFTHIWKPHLKKVRTAQEAQSLIKQGARM